jgi:hypothetical protein
MGIVQVHHRELADYLYSELTKYGYAPEVLIVEHTASIFMKYLIERGARRYESVEQYEQALASEPEDSGAQTS